MSNTEQELPQEVLQALEKGRKVEAIRQLRVMRNLGLKEAKDQVDAWLALHPQQAQAVQRASGGGWALLLLVAFGVLGWWLIRR